MHTNFNILTLSGEFLAQGSRYCKLLLCTDWPTFLGNDIIPRKHGAVNRNWLCCRVH